MGGTSDSLTCADIFFSFLYFTHLLLFALAVFSLEVTELGSVWGKLSGPEGLIHKQRQTQRQKNAAGEVKSKLNLK